MNNNRPSTVEKIEALKEHIGLVHQGAFKLADRLIPAGKEELARRLIANVLQHDYTKFHGFQWEHLWPGDPLLEEAIKDHNKKERHHPEAWDSIHVMTEEYIAELVCDCWARSSQFGTCLYDWFDETAPKKYNYTKRDEVYKTIMYFVGLLCDRKFEPVKPVKKAKEPAKEPMTRFDE